MPDTTEGSLRTPSHGLRFADVVDTDSGSGDDRGIVTSPQRYNSELGSEAQSFLAGEIGHVSTDDEVMPLGTGFVPTLSATNSWTSQQTIRTRTGPKGNGGPAALDTGGTTPLSAVSGKPQRPGVLRTPSNAYAPPRRPSQFASAASHRHRSSSQTRGSRLNPDAEYRAQKKAYAQRLQRDNAEDNEADFPPSLGNSTGSESDEESPSTAEWVDGDLYDQDTMLYYGNEDVQPSLEELKIPANRERLEWHSMLANVLTGDVVKQEKKRLIGSTDLHGDSALWTEVWLGVRARCCGRPVAAHKRMVEDQRSGIPSMVEAIIAFEIKGEAEVGRSAKEQVEDIVQKIGKCESLYPTRQALEAAHPRAGSDSFRDASNAVLSWHNTTALINMELGVLQAWVGNEELDFGKPRVRTSHDGNLTDESSFIDRILKEDGLKSLQDGLLKDFEKDYEKEEEPRKRPKGEGHSLLIGLEKIIRKAKHTLIENYLAFQDRHLPLYMEELLTLINFPSRLVQEIIRMRLVFATRMKDPAQQGVMMAEQMMTQFQILLKLAVRIKEAYIEISQPEEGWDLPPCIDENFDSVILDALKFYFKMLSWKLAANKNTFKEAEILEQEWGFSNELARNIQGGDLEVAEQFSYLTSRSLYRLSTHFEKELQRRPNEVAGAEMDKRYKGILDSVRVRQRKLFRFSRILSQTFENATEYSINFDRTHLKEIYDDLAISGHLLVNTVDGGPSKSYVLASPSLLERPKDIQTLLSTCYRTEDGLDDSTNPYILLIYPEVPLVWEGRVQDVEMRMPKFDIKPGKLRLVADGSQPVLQNANLAFTQSINSELDVLIPQRANLPSIDTQLQKIKRDTWKLSGTIMNSVEIIRKQVVGMQCQELIQTCFAFATEFGQRSILYMDNNRRALNNLKLTQLALDWVSFICDDCVASDRKTFRWAVVALEFAMIMTRGQNILAISIDEYAQLRSKVAGCMSLLISHFDIMGARSTVAAQVEKQRQNDSLTGKGRLDLSKLKDDEESARAVQAEWMAQLEELDEGRKQKEGERQWLGRVLEDSTEADRSLTFLSASSTNVTLRWQQGQFIGGGSFGSVYAAYNLDTGYLMAVKEIRLQDPQLIPTIVSQIRDEMTVLQILNHPNVVSYYGIEVHRDKVYIFMEYCSGGSLAGLLEHGRIEDETVITVYALQMLEGLAYLHESAVVHRDIKPENILLDHNGVIKYVDFGAAKIIAKQGGRTVAGGGGSSAAGGGTRQKSMTGTPMYMSPEVIKGTSGANSGRHGAVDIWSLGCVVLEMATGRRPWASLDNEWAIMYNIAQGNPPQLPTREQLSDSGIDFLRKCFDRDPARRASAAELLQHDWIMQLRNQLSLEPQTPSTESGSGSLSMTSTRSNSGYSPDM